MSKISRRGFLGSAAGVAGAASVFDPVAFFMRNFTGSLVAQARAEVKGEIPRRFMYIQMYASPERWTYDLFLNHKNESGMIPNPNVVNRYVQSGSRYTSGTYELVKKKGIWVPYLWKFDVPTPTGTRPMSDLFDHLLHLRGVDVGNAAHNSAAYLHSRPVAGTPTLGGLVADRIGTLLPAIQVGNVMEYASENGTSLIAASSPAGANLLSDVMMPFQRRTSADFLARRDLLAGNLRRVAGLFKEQYGSYAPQLIGDIENAQNLMEGGLEDLGKAWDGLLAKYVNLIERAVNTVLPGISDRPIGNTDVANRGAEYTFGQDLFNFLPDIRDMLDGASGKRIGITLLAEKFAVAEFMMTRGYSSFFAMHLNNFLGVLTQREPTGAASRANVSHDQHFFGSQIAPFINSYYFLAFSACLLEMIEQFKKTTVVVAGQKRNLWDETVIQTASEFNRCPYKTPRGADHGPQAGSTCIFSGALRGPTVLGNVRAEPSIEANRVNYPGSWGWNAPVAGLRNRPINLGNVQSTLATLLRVETPSINNMSLVSENGTPLIEEGIFVPSEKKAGG